MLNRRNFIKMSSMAVLGFVMAGGEVFAATGGKADLVVCGKIFTSDKNKIVEAFAVKNGKFIYVGDKNGVEKFIDKNNTKIINYTMYIDGYSSYFFNDVYYKAANQFDKSGKMNFVLGLAYETDSWMNIDANLQKAVDVQKYASKHVKTNWIKLFIDGTPESGTGFIDPVYLDGHQGIANWTEKEVTEITRKANAKNLTMHIHAMGNSAINRTVNSYVNGGKNEMRNTIVHLRNVNAEDYKRMADHNIFVTAGIFWHHDSEENQADMLTKFQEDMPLKGYPMKSFFDNGINITSHSDFPALSHSPDDPFGIIEIALTGVYHEENAKEWWTEELITREQALQALTINVANQMFLENERGSISTGKYADFLLVNKDILTCPVTEIHEAKPISTYFEGKEVYKA